MSGYQYSQYAAGPAPAPSVMPQQFVPTTGYYQQPQQPQQQPSPQAAFPGFAQAQPMGYATYTTPSPQAAYQYSQQQSPASAYSPQPSIAHSSKPDPGNKTTSCAASGSSSNMRVAVLPSSPTAYASPTPGGIPTPPAMQNMAYNTAVPGQATNNIPVCSGRKKALLIGINYFGQRGQLRGCINDVKNMSAYLVEQFGYKREDMVILTDDQHNPIGHPTKHNILRAMHWLTKGAQPNDSLFFHYSGHGGQTKDDTNEPEGYDEVIYPVDFRQNGHITDDEMHRIMVQPLCKGVRLTAIFDSCHSGTALDLPYIYSTQGIMKAPDSVHEAGEALIMTLSSYGQGEASFGDVAGRVKKGFKHIMGGVDKELKPSEADVIMFSGSKSNQKSADAMVDSQPTGAMSSAFISALRKNPQQSYVQLLNSIRDELASKYTQRPQLSCSHILNTNLLFVM